MESKILLGKILQRFRDQQFVQVEGYNRFEYIRETEKAVWVTREKGADTPVPFNKLIKGIEAFQNDPNLYKEGPSAIREFGITHVTSPVWSLLHLLDINDFKSK